MRCIKPNPDRRALHFEQPFVLRQLNYAGVLETIRIRKDGFPIRLRYQRFVEEFSVVAFDWCMQGQVPTTATMARRILEKTGDTDWLLGKTKIFIKERHRKTLYNLKTRFFHMAAEAQRFARGYLGRRVYRELLKEKAASAAVVETFFSTIERHTVAQRVQATVQEGSAKLLAEASRKMDIASQLATMALRRVNKRNGVANEEEEGGARARPPPPPPPIAPKPAFLQKGKKRPSNEALQPVPPRKRASVDAIELGAGKTDAGGGGESGGDQRDPAVSSNNHDDNNDHNNHDNDNDNDDNEAARATLINKVVYRTLIHAVEGREVPPLAATTASGSSASLRSGEQRTGRPSMSSQTLSMSSDAASAPEAQEAAPTGRRRSGVLRALKRKLSIKLKAEQAQEEAGGPAGSGDERWKETPKMKRSLSSLGRMAAQMGGGADDDGAGRAETFLDFLDAFSNKVSQMAPCTRPGCKELFFSMRELERHVAEAHGALEPVLGQGERAEAAEGSRREAETQPPPGEAPRATQYMSLTEDVAWLDDKARALSCVYWEHAVPVAQFAVAAQESAHVMCARAGKVAARASPGSALLDLAELGNPFRHARTQRVRKFIGSGVEISVRQRSLYLTRHSRNGVFAKHWAQRGERYCLPLREGDSEGLVHDDVAADGALPLNKEVCLFDFQVFRKQLMHLSAGEAMLKATVSLALVRNSAERADTPAWLTVRMCDALRLWERHHHSGPVSLY